MKLPTLMLVVALAGCGKKTEKGPPVEPAGSGSAVVETGSGSAAAPELGSGSGSGSAVAEAPIEVPTEVDFEAKAAEEITDKNVDAKLKALESELAPQ